MGVFCLFWLTIRKILIWHCRSKSGRRFTKRYPQTFKALTKLFSNFKYYQASLKMKSKNGFCYIMLSGDIFNKLSTYFWIFHPFPWQESVGVEPTRPKAYHNVCCSNQLSYPIRQGEGIEPSTHKSRVKTNKKKSSILTT